MTLEEYEQIGNLYQAALECEPAERAMFLAEACGGDESLRREVESLLAAREQADNFIEQAPDDVAAGWQVAAGALSGRDFSHYRILSLLGRGGMGEVWLAEDTRLGRQVAIKLLPDEYTTDIGRVRRFEQEARAASALNHPNIVTIHEIGVVDSMHYIVTEHIDGETLRRRMTNAPQCRLSLAEALDVAAQIAAALAAAHEAGIIHRDIKPENVMARRDGLVKVLDFGLAKLTEQSPPVIDSQHPTLAAHRTDTGVVMGTPRYMSPEQARGERVDARTDIFSLGVVVYEMLAGRAPFTGATASDCLAAILKDEPPELSETNGKVTPQLEKIVRRCLEKKPERRFQSASDLAFALEAFGASSSARPESQLDTAALPAAPDGGDRSRAPRREWLAWAVAALLLLSTLGLTRAYFTRQPASDERVFKTSITPPEKSSFGQVALSPDGRHLAFTAATGGKVQLWAQALDSTEARPLVGTEGATYPFWSPDSRFIGFSADGWLKKIEFTGGLAQKLCEAPVPFGAAWSRDGVILFGQPEVGLSRISEKGGEVTQVTILDRSRKEFLHRYPTFLPDGRHFIYGILSGQEEARGVYLGSLDGPVRQRRLLEDFTVVKYMAASPGDTASGAGWLVYERNGALLARPFDTNQFEFTGEQFTISNTLGSNPFGTNDMTFSVSDNGVLVYDPSPNRTRRKYLYVDRRGQPINLLDVDAGNFHPWFSPDEKRFIADRRDTKNYTLDLWIYELSRGAASPFTFDPAADISPVWEPNASRIVWASTREGVSNLYQKAANRAGEETLLWKSDYPKHPTDWSRDGSFIIYRQVVPKTKSDIWFLPATGSGAQPISVVHTNANETAGTLSPDGHWLAYASDETGRYEIWVQRYPGGDSKQQISIGGGKGPRWRRNGRELFYYSVDGKLMAAQVRTGESFEVVAAFPLFEFVAGTNPDFAPYAVTRDGQRFLINAVVDKEPNAPLTIEVNWTARLPRK